MAGIEHGRGSLLHGKAYIGPSRARAMALTPEEHARRLRFYEAYPSDNQAAFAIGIGQSSFSVWRRRQGLPSKHTGVVHTPRRPKPDLEAPPVPPEQLERVSGPSGRAEFDLEPSRPVFARGGVRVDLDATRSVEDIEEMAERVSVGISLLRSVTGRRVLISMATARRGISAIEIVAYSGVSTPTAFRCVHAARRLGLVEDAGSMMGSRQHRHRVHALTARGRRALDLAMEAEPIMQELAALLGEDE